MEKSLGQEIKDNEKRRQYLIDNADELAERKIKLAEVSIAINEIAPMIPILEK